MLTPIDIQNKTLKAGMGYKKSDVDALIAELFTDYEYLYRKNAELKEKMHVLSEGIQYYKKIEKTIQGALVLAEQTAGETQRVAEEKSRAIIERANNEAAAIVAEAKNELKTVEKATRQLMQEYERYRLNFKHMMTAQLELLESEDKNISRISSQITDRINQPEAAPQTMASIVRPSAETPKTFEAAHTNSVEEYSMAELDALKKEGEKVAQNMAALESAEKNAADETIAEEKTDFDEDLYLAVTKDLSAESKAVMDLLQKMEAGENSSIKDILKETEASTGDEEDDNPFEFFDADDNN